MENVYLVRDYPILKINDFSQIRAWMGREPGVGLGNRAISVFTTEPLQKELVSCPFHPLLHTSDQGERKGTEACEGRSNPSPDPWCLINRGGRRRGQDEWELGVIVHHFSKLASVLLAVPSVPVLLGVGKSKGMPAGEIEVTWPHSVQIPPIPGPPNQASQVAPVPRSPAPGPPSSRGSASAGSDPALGKEEVSLCRREEGANGGARKLFL